MKRLLCLPLLAIAFATTAAAQDLTCHYYDADQNRCGNPFIRCSPGWTGYARPDTTGITSATFQVGNKTLTLSNPGFDLGALRDGIGYADPAKNQPMINKLKAAGATDADLSDWTKISLSSFTVSPADMVLYPDSGCADAKKNADLRIYCPTAVNQHPHPAAGAANQAFGSEYVAKMSAQDKAKFKQLGGFQCQFGSYDDNKSQVVPGNLLPTVGRGCGQMTVCYSSVVCQGQTPDEDGKWTTHAHTLGAACADCSMTLDQCVMDDRASYENPLAANLPNVAFPDPKSVTPSSSSAPPAD